MTTPKHQDRMILGTFGACTFAGAVFAGAIFYSNPFAIFVGGFFGSWAAFWLLRDFAVTARRED